MSNFNWDKYPTAPQEKSNESPESSFNWDKYEAVAPEESNLQKAARATARGARTVGANLVAFLPDTAGFLADAVTYPAAKFDEMLRDVPEEMQRKSFDKYNPHATEAIKNKIDELSGGYTKPQSKREEIADQALDFASVLLPGAGVAKGIKIAAPHLKKLANIIESAFAPTAENIGASIGSGAISKAYEQENPDDALGNLAATMGGGVLGGMTGKGLTSLPKALKSEVVRHPIEAAKNKIADTYAQKLNIDPELYARNEALGLPVTAGQISSDAGTVAREEILRKHPASGGRFKESDVAREREIARNLGVSDPENLKATVKNIDKGIAKQGASGYKERLTNIFKHYEEKFSKRQQKAIENREMVDVSDMYEELSKAQKGLKKSKELKDFEKTIPGHFRKQIEEYSDTALTSKDISNLRKQGYNDEMISKLEHQLGGSNQKAVGYAGLEALRKEAKVLKDNAKRGSEEYKNASQVYDMLSRKRREFMERTGTPQEKHAAKRARKIYYQYASRDQMNYKKYVQEVTDSSSDAAAFAKLVSKDPKYMHIARVGLPKDEQRALGERVIEHLGKQQGRFNINTAHTQYEKLEPGVKAELAQTFRNTTERERFLDTLDLIGENKEAIEKVANTSRSAHTLTSTQAKEEIINAAASGNVKGVIVRLIKNGIYNLEAKAYTDPVFLKRMSDITKARSSKELVNRTDLLLHSPILKSLSRLKYPSVKKEDEKE